MAYENEEVHEKKHFVWCTSALLDVKQKMTKQYLGLAKALIQPYVKCRFNIYAITFLNISYNYMLKTALVC